MKTSGAWRLILVPLVSLAIAGGVVALVALRDDSAPAAGSSDSPPHATAAVPAPSRPAPAPRYGAGAAPTQLRFTFKHAPRGAMLFDLRSGRVLWSRLPYRSRPIASLAKMMTAIIVAERARPDEQVLISQRAISFEGSGVGNLPLGRRVRLETLLYGLLLPSGNDAAIALAEHVSGSVERFVRVMNAQARRLGLRCTHFSTPSGIEDRGNRSCPRDLAVMAREVMRRPRLAKVVGSRSASFPFVFRERKEEHKKTTARVGKKKVVTDHVTVKYVYRSGRLDLYSHNPLLKLGYRGTTGVKTGHTDAAGRCFVGTVRRGRFQLGVVLLHSPDPGAQAQRLLTRAFDALHWLRPAAPR